MTSQLVQTPLTLDIAIVGCGISGLAAAYALGKAGHRITVVESSPLLTEVGAGIQVSPNVSRILIKWGLGDQLEKLGVQPKAIFFRRYENDDIVGLNPIKADIQKRFGAPYWVVHRADLLQTLYQAAKPFINLVQDRVTSLDTTPGGSPYITTETGRVIHADIVLGADGIKSVVRSFVTNQKDRPRPTGDMAYRVLIPTDLLMDDPLLRPLVEDPGVTIWMGPHRHIVAYCVSAKKFYNLVLVRPDLGSEESWSSEADPDEIKKTYEGWSPIVTRLVSLIKKGMISRLVVRDPLKTWLHPNGRVTLLGDACHSMLPYVAQGAAMAVEDAAVLGSLFSGITSRSQIPDLLRAYESLRIPRTTNTQLAAQSNQGAFHLPDGPEQQARDAAMYKMMHEKQLTEERGDEAINDEAEGDRLRTKVLYSYDVDAALREWYRAGGYRVYQQESKL